MPDEPLIDFTLLSWLDRFDPYDRFDRPTLGGRSGDLTGDLVDGFARAVEEAGGACHRVVGEIPDSLLDRLVADLGAWDIVCPEDIDDSGLAHRLRHRGAVVSPADPQHAATAVMGITSPVAAIADTGSLLVNASHQPTLMATLLPPVHLCVLPAGRLVRTARDVPGRLRRDHFARPPATLTLTAGPHPTNTPPPHPTHGIHHPEELHVILVR